jgi:hypothetical protein
LYRENPVGPVHLCPRDIALECRWFLGLRPGSQQNKAKRQKPNYSHSMVAGGLDEMS